MSSGFDTALRPVHQKNTETGPVLATAEETEIPEKSSPAPKNVPSERKRLLLWISAALPELSFLHRAANIGLVVDVRVSRCVRLEGTEAPFASTSRTLPYPDPLQPRRTGHGGPIGVVKVCRPRARESRTVTLGLAMGLRLKTPTTPRAYCDV